MRMWYFTIGEVLNYMTLKRAIFINNDKSCLDCCI